MVSHVLSLTKIKAKINIVGGLERKVKIHNKGMVNLLQNTYFRNQTVKAGDSVRHRESVEKFSRIEI